MPRQAKITPEQLRKELHAGANQAQIAAKYGMDVANVSRQVKKLKDSAMIAGAALEEAVASVEVYPETPTKPARKGRKRAKAADPDDDDDQLPAYDDELSLWDTKAALDANFAQVNFLLGPKQWTDTKTKVRILAEKRAHIALGVQVMQTIYAVHEHQEFQRIVIEVMDEIEPGSRQRILERLRQRTALRRAVPDA